MDDLARLDLPPVVSRFLATHGATRSGLRGDAEATTSLLVERGLPARAPVLAFEAAFGGLELFEPDDEAPTLVVGPFACLSATPPWTGSQTELVPVVFAIDDVVHYLDPDGRGWSCATMGGGGTRPSAHDGHGLFVQAVLWRILVNQPRAFETLPGQHGAELAARANARPITIACGPTERWWGDDDRLIVEIDYGNGATTPTTYTTR